ncbi:MAG: tRNA glutamyl-Q(34) synthetase GluQRS [Gemmataceae bacterium]|nr:tRNA glutamyl-Q(34) synthetase GluQRS [Gemmataceae bacterium]
MPSPTPRPLRARLAPSPTGAQHVGNARTYLIAWLSARSQGAEVRLRIEDIDSPRIKQGSTDLILEDLCWLGLNFTGEPIIQTTRIPLYDAALERLRELELVYPCTCTRGDIEQAASAPHVEHEGPRYPGTCSHRRSGEANSLGTRPFAWRFRVNASPTFTDRFLGELSIDIRELGGDFVVWKSAGTPAYQLAVVVDDAAMGITEVIRGDDLAPSTPRQLLLYRALDLEPPVFAHVPLVIGQDGRRLAKRHGDTRLASLRKDGVQPESVIGLLAWSCGWVGEPRAISATELIPLFRLDTVPRSPFVLTSELLKKIETSR